MSTPLQQWLTQVDKSFSDVTKGTERSRLFLRDPMRLTTSNRSRFFAPADGVLIYQKRVDRQDVVDIKGKPYTLPELLENPRAEFPCIVIGIFMTVYDVHVNRMPYGGVLRFESLTPIASNNKPMDFVQDDIMAKQLGKILPDMDYAQMNARMVNEVYVPQLDYRYFITQIADDEVNVITHFTVKQNQWFHQNARFSVVRWGSQVEMVLPLTERFSLTTLLPDYHHVRAGVDALVEIKHPH